jgi:hypothetical protein
MADQRELQRRNQELIRQNRKLERVPRVNQVECRDNLVERF